MADDCYLGPKYLISSRVIEMEVSVDQIAHRLIGDQFHILQKVVRGGGGAGVIHEQHVIVVDNDRMVGPKASRGVIDALGDLLELVNFALDNWKVRED